VKTSWKTTAAGVGAILVAIGGALAATFDTDPATVADWGAVVAAFMAGIGLLFARDNNVTSEQAGASKPPVQP
jgi:hypothetical protein